MRRSQNARSARSLKSRRSGRSGRSKMSRRSSGSLHGSAERREHPYDKVFSKEVNQKIHKTPVQMIKLTFNDFKQIQFDTCLPTIIDDIIDYLTGFKISEHERVQREKAKIDAEKKVIQDKYKAAKLADPTLKEDVFTERYQQ